MRKPEPLAPVVVPPEAEQAFGLGAAPAPVKPAAPAALPAPAAYATQASTAPAAPEPEKSKTFFLPYAICDRLEMQKLSERREMKYILRQALEEYFERNPLRPGIRDIYSK